MTATLEIRYESGDKYLQDPHQKQVFSFELCNEDVKITQISINQIPHSSPPPPTRDGTKEGEEEARSEDSRQRTETTSSKDTPVHP